VDEEASADAKSVLGCGQSSGYHKTIEGAAGMPLTLDVLWAKINLWWLHGEVQREQERLQHCKDCIDYDRAKMLEWELRLMNLEVGK